MKAKNKKLMREQLDITLGRFKRLKATSPPQKGWIRAVRDALGMTGGQLAKRLDVNKQRVARIERDETGGKITLKTLMHVAEALDCVCVYGIVPKTTLKQTIKRQAALVAASRMSRVDQTMRLEKQGLSEAEKLKVLKQQIEDIINAMPKSLWE
jgi:predicted DNA-binding mobile mystery protein A